MTKHLIALTLAALLLAGCSYDIDKTGGAGQGAFNAPGAVMDFNTVFQGIIRPKCATCHSGAGGNRGGINLETYEAVFAARGGIQGAVEGGFMPPRSAAALTAGEKSFLLAWIAAGAPRNAAAVPVNPADPTNPANPNPTNPTPPNPRPPVDDDCKRHGDDDDDDDRDDDTCETNGTPLPPAQPAPPTQPGTNAPDFAMVFEQVFAPRCIGCHGDRGDVNLETYENVFANRQAIVDAVDGGFMPPRSRGPLTPEQKDLLMRWIQSGAPFTNP